MAGFCNFVCLQNICNDYKHMPIPPPPKKKPQPKPNKQKHGFFFIKTLVLELLFLDVLLNYIVWTYICYLVDLQTYILILHEFLWTVRMGSYLLSMRLDFCSLRNENITMIILSRALTTYLLVSKLSLFEQGFSQSIDFFWK